MKLLWLFVAGAVLFGQAPQGVTQRTQPPGRPVGAANQPGAVTLKDGTRLLPATTVAPPNSLDLAWRAPAGNSQPQARKAPGSTGATSTQSQQSQAALAQELAKRATIGTNGGILGEAVAENPLGGKVTNPRKGKSEKDEADEALRERNALLEAALEQQTKNAEKMGENAKAVADIAYGGGGKREEALAVDPELALIMAQINPRTGKPRQRASEIAREHGLAMVPAGTILHIRSITRVQTQLGGTAVGIVERDVWDANMRAVLIPRGSKALAVIQQVSNDAQDRAALVFRQLVDPNGDQIQLLVQEPATNAIGMSGIEGNVNRHFGVKFGGALAWGLLSGLAGTGSKTAANPGSNFGDVVQSNVAAQFGQVGQNFLQKAVDVRPDIEVPENTSMKVIVGSPIYLKPWREIRPF